MTAVEELADEVDKNGERPQVPHRIQKRSKQTLQGIQERVDRQRRLLTVARAISNDQKCPAREDGPSARFSEQQLSPFAKPMSGKQQWKDEGPQDANLAVWQLRKLNETRSLNQDQDVKDNRAMRAVLKLMGAASLDQNQYVEDLGDPMDIDPPVKPPVKKKSFMDLPPEIRNLIYKKYAEDRKTRLPYEKLTGHVSDWFSPTILQLNRRIRWEAEPFLYSGKIEITLLSSSIPGLTMNYTPRLPIFSQFQHCVVFINCFRFMNPQLRGLIRCKFLDNLSVYRRAQHFLAEELKHFSWLRKLELFFSDEVEPTEDNVCESDLVYPFIERMGLSCDLMCFMPLTNLMEVFSRHPKRQEFKPVVIRSDIEREEEALNYFCHRHSAYRRFSLEVCKCTKKKIEEIEVNLNAIRGL